ncbi:MAG: hypothetical protein IRZ29_09835, partial [Thermoflavifilum sp.]|nr:hypothetical protein [Thermoflavifilum sp.]
MKKWRSGLQGLLQIWVFLIPIVSGAQVNLNQVLSGGQNNTAQQDSIYATMEVPAEKLATKKFTLTRRWYQNLVTHFNFVYNARQNLNKAIQMATDLHQDHYSSLLDFYPYTFTELAQATSLLDSVIFRASVGIQVHDPRGKWIDNLYLLLGKAYYYEQKFAEAERAFQLVNLRYAPAVKGEYVPVIGSQAEGSTQISIATPEKPGFFHHHPSRNEALLWLVKTYLAEQQIDKARSLLNQLLHDPRFPSRLNGALQETAAFFYCQLQQYDLAIPYLREAIALQDQRMLQSRWAYLLGQLELLQQDTAQALAAFQQAAHLSHDPLLQFHAAYQTTLLQPSSADHPNSPYARLEEMARKNRYERYRDIIYHGLAQIALLRADTPKAISYLFSSLHAQASPSRARGNSALLLADLMMEEKHFVRAAALLDTALQALPDDDPRRDSLQERLLAMKMLSAQMAIVYRQDSLQQLAALPPEDRMRKVHEIWEDMLAQQRRAQKAARRAAQQNSGQIAASEMDNLAAPATGRPGSDVSGGSGNWYFNNPDLKASGYVAFKQIWGNRPLVDNWRRASAIQGFTPTLTAQPADTALATILSHHADSTLSLGERALLMNIPLTPEQQKASNDSICQALLQAAQILVFQLHRPDLAKDELNSLLQRNPQPDNYAEVGYMLFLTYRHLHDSSQAAYYREVLLKNYSQTPFAQALQPAPPNHTFRLSALYDSAYMHYTAQQYDNALQWIEQALARHPADSIQAQFVLLQAMSYIKLNREDTAHRMLETIALQHPDLPAGMEAKRILDVWQHKQQLIAHLESLSAPGKAKHELAIAQSPASQPTPQPNPQPAPAKAQATDSTA